MTFCIATLIAAMGTAASPPQVATPVLSPDPGTYDWMQLILVTLSDATPNAAIYFTYDGTDPTTASVLYTGPIDVSFESTWMYTITIRAIAVADGFTNSEIVTGTYILGQTYPGICTIDDVTGEFDGYCWTQTYQGCFADLSPACVGSAVRSPGDFCMYGLSVSSTVCTFTGPPTIPF